jgi:hypothetical protein
MLSTVPPGGGERADEYIYDPNDPVPSLGGNNLAIASLLERKSGAKPDRSK